MAAPLGLLVFFGWPLSSVYAVRLYVSVNLIMIGVTRVLTARAGFGARQIVSGP